MPIPDADKVALTPADVEAAQLPEWEWDEGCLRARFATGSFSAGAALVGEIAVAADAMDHHPDVDLRYPYLDVRLSSHDVAAVTQRDVRLAREISRLAAEAAEAAAT